MLYARKYPLDMSSIVFISERSSRLFIEAFWTMLEGVALLLKGTCILCAAIILNIGLLFASLYNLLMILAVCFIIALAIIHKLLFDTVKPSVETVANSPAARC